MMMTEVVPVLTLYCPDFGNRFDGQSIEDVMREYMSQLHNSGLRASDVRRGIERLKIRKEKWTPTPNEFVELCKPSSTDLGLPSIEEAYADIDQACRHATRSPKPYRYKHRMTELIAKDIRHYFRLATEEKRQTMLKKSFDKWLEVARTEGLPEPVERISRYAEPRPVCTRYQGPQLGGLLGEKVRRIQRNLAAKNKTQGERHCG